MENSKFYYSRNRVFQKKLWKISYENAMQRFQTNFKNYVLNSISLKFLRCPCKQKEKKLLFEDILLKSIDINMPPLIRMTRA